MNDEILKNNNLKRDKKIKKIRMKFDI